MGVESIWITGHLGGEMRPLCCDTGAKMALEVTGLISHCDDCNIFRGIVSILSPEWSWLHSQYHVVCKPVDPVNQHPRSWEKYGRNYRRFWHLELWLQSNKLIFIDSGFSPGAGCLNTQWILVFRFTKPGKTNLSSGMWFHVIFCLGNFSTCHVVTVTSSRLKSTILFWRAEWNVLNQHKNGIE